MKNGSSRFVFISDRIIVKIPKINFGTGIRCIVRDVKHGKLIQNSKKYNCEQYNVAQYYLLKGILNNWQEYVFYRKNRHLKILAPTIFSFLGLFNIQKKCAKLKVEEGNFFGQLTDLSNREVWSDSHTFSNPANFGILEGKIRIFDYGSVYAQEVLLKYGERIYNEFKI